MQRFVVVFSLFVIASVAVLGQTAGDVRPLSPDQTIERTMNGAETHRYSVELKAGEFFQARVEQKGADVLLKLLDAGGKELARMDSPNDAEGFEILTFVSEVPAKMTLEISGFDAAAKDGKYSVYRAKTRPATVKDRRRVEVEHISVEALNLRDTEKDIELSTPKFLAALDGWEELGDVAMTAMMWDQVKRIYVNFTSDTLYNEGSDFLKKNTDADWKKAALRFDVASRVYREEGNKQYEAFSMLRLGATLSKLNEDQKTLDVYLRLLKLEREIANKPDEAVVLHNIGLTYDRLGEPQKAIEFYNLALAANRAISNRNDEALTLFNTGIVYSGLGNMKTAFQLFNQSLAIYRSLDNKRMQSSVLASIGVAYGRLDEYEKALATHFESLKLANESDNNSGFAVATANIGFVFDALGEKQKALEFYDQALQLYRLLNDKKGEAAILLNIGKVNANLGKYKEAVEFYNQSLVIKKAVGDRRGEALALNNLGTAYAAGGDLKKSLDTLLQSLAIRKAIGDRAGESLVLSNIARTYADLKDYPKARENFYQSLLLRRTLGDVGGEAETLASLRLFWAVRENPRLAVFFGKQSIGNFQELRGKIKDLDGETQKVFLKTIEDRYKKLAETLIESNRPAEAQQVLNLYQDQQFFDFNGGDGETVKQIIKTPREETFAGLYKKAAENIQTTADELVELKRNVAFRTASADEINRIKQLETNLQTAEKEFFAVLERAEKEFSQPPDAKDKIPAIADLSEMQTALRETSAASGQKSVAVYTLVADKNFYLILITPDEIKTFKPEKEISAEDLNESIVQFYAVLQSPEKDPRPLGKELYDIIFKPLESSLPKDTRIVAWALDGNLRYVPIAALFDGEKYLVERFQTAVFTRAERGRMTSVVSKDWTGTGFGSSNAHEVDLFGDGDKIPFGALPGVKTELEAIFRSPQNKNGIIEGNVLMDASFGKAAFFDRLKQKRPLVHIASHFNFRPGDAARSFLLLGDGTALTLNEMKANKDLFAGVELLTLSACNTAATRKDANGREVDGFAELAQRLGADAVMASLWAVSDESTQQLMSEFYRLRKENPQMTKAEAIQTAQMALIGGKLQTQTKTNADRSGVYSGTKLSANAPKFVPDDKKPFAHPFFWSPFVLIGNWK